MNKGLFLMALMVAGSALVAADEGLVEEQVANPWHFRMAPVMAPRVRVKLHGPRFNKPAIKANGAVERGNYDAKLIADDGVTRLYDDGKVGPDTGSDVDQHTWNWSADNLGNQYDHDNHTLTFHTEATRWEDTYTSRETGGGALSDSDRDILLGLEAMGGWTFYDGQTFDAAVDCGFRYYGNDHFSLGSYYDAKVTAMRQDYRQVYTYAAEGWPNNWQDLIGNQAYEGGERGVVGPGIAVNPNQQPDEALGVPYDFPEAPQAKDLNYRARTRLDYRIWDLRMGPTMGWKATDYLVIRGGMYGLLGLVDAKLRTSVQDDQGNHMAKKSICDPLFGMAFALSAELGLTDNIFLYSGTEYIWWTDTVNVRTGGAKGHLELSDFTVSVGLGINF